MRTLVTAIVLVLVALGGLAAYSASRAARLGEVYPPVGRLARIDDARIHFVDLGPRDGHAVVLLHGASANLRDPLTALEGRLDGSYRVVAIDRPGHGWSQRGDDPDAALPSVQARYVIGLLDELGVDRAIFVAHSWSGALALDLALDYPQRTAGLVLLAPATHPWPGGINWYYTVATLPAVGMLFTGAMVLPAGELLMDRAIHSVFAPQEPPADYAEKAAAALVFRPAAFRANAGDISELLEFVAEQSKRYGEISVPTSILTGTADRTVSPRVHSRALAAQIKGARLVELKDVGHMVQFAAPDAVVAEVDRIAGVLGWKPAPEAPASSAPMQVDSGSAVVGEEATPR